MGADEPVSNIADAFEILLRTQPRKSRNSSKVNLVIAIVFHGLIVLAVVYFAAREGVLGKQLKKLTISIIKEDKPKEKPKEPEKPKEEPPKEETPKLTVTPAITPPKEAARSSASPGSAMAPAVAPPPAELAGFDFDGGKTVTTGGDLAAVYKGLVESSLRAQWDRPTDADDFLYAAEVEVSVDSSGNISDPVWKKGSGNKRWDDSVRQAIARTKSVDLPPPKNFPSHVLVRFDVTRESQPTMP